MKRIINCAYSPVNISLDISYPVHGSLGLCLIKIFKYSAYLNAYLKNDSTHNLRQNICLSSLKITNFITTYETRS